MFENIVDSRTEKESGEIDKLTDTLKEGDFINRIMILNSDLSEFTKNYLLYEFDEESSADELKSRISKANKLYFNYALRPKWTIQTFLFNNFESRPPNEILKKLIIFPFYSYYLDSIRDSIKDNFQIFITRSELVSIIDSVNHSIYDKLSVDINSVKIKNFLLQLFLIKYEKESECNLESKIPFSFLKIFLEDKSYPDFIKKFNIVKDLESSTELSLKDIIKVLTDKYNITEIPEKAEVEEREILKEENKEIENEIDLRKGIETEVEDDEEIIIKSVDEIDSKKIDLTEKINSGKEEIKESIKESNKEKKKDKEDEQDWKIVKKNENDPILKKKDSFLQENKDIIKGETQKKETQDVNTKKAETKKSEAGNKIYREENDEIESKPSKAHKKNEISNLFEEKKTEKILKKVYNGDLILMDKSFDKLVNFRKWDEASDHLMVIFKNNEVDIYNKEVVYFVDKLNEYFKNNK